MQNVNFMIGLNKNDHVLEIVFDLHFYAYLKVNLLEMKLLKWFLCLTVLSRVHFLEKLKIISYLWRASTIITKITEIYGINYLS